MGCLINNVATYIHRQEYIRILLTCISMYVCMYVHPNVLFCLLAIATYLLKNGNNYVRI